MTNARLPAVPPVDLKDAQANRWAQAVTEWIRVRSGGANPLERAVTVRELGDIPASPVKPRQPVQGEVSLPLGNGLTANISLEQFSQLIKRTPLYSDLVRSLDDPTRFNVLMQEAQGVLKRAILDEAATRGADIQRVESKIQEATRSFAMSVTELTAAIDVAEAGLREVQVVQVSENEARAEQITQLSAQLNTPVSDVEKLPPPPAAAYATLTALQTAVPVGNPDFYYRVTNPSGGETLYIWDGGAYLDAGTNSTARMEQRMAAVSNRVTGTESQYTMKLNAGGAVAGFGLAASAPVAGAGTSAFLVQADKIAFVGAGDTIGTGPGEIDPVNPDPTRVPFGVDAASGTVYINGQLRVGGTTGPTLGSISSAAGVYLTYTSQFFKYNAAGTALNTSVTITANVSGELEGTLEWAALSGYSGSVPADVTITTSLSTASWTVNVADLTGDVAAFSVTLTTLHTGYSDAVTLVKLRDGADSYTARLTNNSAGVATTNAGVPLTGGFGNATGTMEVYHGATKLTSGVVYSVFDNANGLTCSIGSTSGVFSVTANGSWPDATNVAELTLRAVVAGGPTLDQKFTLTKNRQAIYTDYIFQRALTPTTPPTGWSDTPPTGTIPLWMSQATKNVSDDSLVGSWSTAVRLDGAAGATGASGPYTVYQWAVSASSTVAPSVWSSTALTPSTGQFLWMRAGTVVPPAATPSSWGSGYRVSGEKGEAGANGLTTALVYAYQRSVNMPTGTPGAVVYSFVDKAISTASLPGGWQKTMPSGTDPLWVVVATAQSATDTDGIASGEWSTPVKLAENGVAGMNSAPVMIYARTSTETAPTITAGTSTYAFSTGVLSSLPTGNAVWTQAAPTSGGSFLWVAHATAANTTSTDLIAFTEWSTPRLVAKDGTNGLNGLPAVQIDLSNDSHGVPSNVDGSNPNFTGATTTASIFEGPTDTSASWTWTTSAVNLTITGANTRTVTVTAMSADSGYVDFTATRTGYTSQTARFSVVRFRGGSYEAWSSVDVINRDTAGVYTPGTVTFTGKLRAADGSVTDYAGRFSIATSTNGTSWTAQYSSAANEATKAYTLPAGVSHVRVQLFQAGGTGLLLDEEVMPVLDDGATAKTAILSADAFIFKADNTNAIQSPTSIRMEVLRQNTTANVTWSTTPTVNLYTAASGGTLVTQGSPVATTVVYMRATDYGTNTNVKVTTTCDGISDSASIFRSVDGDDAPVAVLSNPSHPLPASSAGVVSSYTGSGTTVQVITGGVARTITALTRVGTAITPGAVSGTGTTTATLANHSAITADTATVACTITYTKADGTSGTTYATQSLYKNKSGVDGTNGTNGVNGSTGVRGTIVTKITGAWNATTAAAQIASIATAASATPTTPIKGDIVYYTGGANECTVAGNPGTWGGVAAYIDGSLVVTGTISADKVNAEGLKVGSGGAIAATGYPGFSLSGAAPPNAGAAFAGARFGIGTGGFTHVDTLLCWGQIFTATFGAKAAVTSPVVYGESTVGGTGVAGKSTSGNGGSFAGNATKAPLMLEPLGALPSDKTAGQLCSVGGVLYYANGSAWKIVNLT